MICELGVWFEVQCAGVPVKPQQYGGGAPPAYRPRPLPPPRRRRKRRSCCCACCLWLTLILIGLVFVVAIAAGVFYVLYHPQRPTFSVTSLHLAKLNVSSSSDLLTSALDFTLVARNPNRKIVFVYGDIAVSAAADGIPIGTASIPGFVHAAGNTTWIAATLASSGNNLDPTAAADLRSKKRFPMEIEVDTRAGVEIGRFKSKRIGIRVSCSGFDAAVASAKATPSTSIAKCKPQIKIWIWTF
ncbi:Protein YLS9 [Ananas comosus]|uniref:Protein YLS9 n=1 Tax=Ananas comosus TaxID=4615 RepID=A0A199VF59_ANACO|nr:Protein YLS9 [Ananas comosus]